MDEHDVIRFIRRFPDNINGTRMESKKWKCSLCQEIYKFKEEVPVPAPCEKCEGIFFEKISE